MDFSNYDDKAVDQFVSNILASPQLRESLKNLVRLGVPSVRTAYRGTGGYLQPDDDDDDIPLDTGHASVTGVTSGTTLTKSGGTGSSNASVQGAVIVIDYSAKSHAIFCDMSNTALVDELGRINWLARQPRLAYGDGWVVMRKSMVPALKEVCKKHGSSVREVSRQLFDLEFKGITSQPNPDPTPPSSQTPAKEEDSNVAEESSGNDADESDDDNNESESEYAKLDALLTGNKWGNNWIESTRLVAALTNGTWTIVGRQDRHSKIKGPGSILPLTDDDRALCKKNHWKHA